MDIAEAIAHANCSAALSASPEHVAEAIQVLAARVAELEAEHDDGICTDCRTCSAEMRRLRDLEAELGEPTGTEWGVRWAGRPDEGGGIEQHHERTPDGGERYARRVVGIHDPYGRGSAVLVKRQLGPWVVAQ